MIAADGLNLGALAHLCLDDFVKGISRQGGGGQIGRQEVLEGHLGEVGGGVFAGDGEVGGVQDGGVEGLGLLPAASGDATRGDADATPGGGVAGLEDAPALEASWWGWVDSDLEGASVVGDVGERDARSSGGVEGRVESAVVLLEAGKGRREGDADGGGLPELYVVVQIELTLESTPWR